MRQLRHVLIVLLTTLACLLGVTSAYAVQSPQASVVADRAVSWTPAIDDGAVQAIVQAGDTIVVGGTFTTVTPSSGGTTVSRPYVLAFSATTGQIRTGFQPVLDGAVNALVASPDGQSVYVGGSFGYVNGERAKGVVQLSLADGSRVTSFRTPAMNGVVTDLRLSKGRLWLGGSFSRLAGHDQAAIGTVNATTGAYDPFFSLTVAGTHNGGRTSLQKFDVTPDGSKLLAIGNFTTVGGQTRHQVVLLDLTGATAAVGAWNTQFFTYTGCARVFDSYMRDLDISPDGTYAVISTTGAYHGYTSPCDSTTRWELGVTGTNLSPTWTDYTGGDTTYAVAVTGTAVYVGGHFRWQNNAYAGDRAGQGAVAREGIAALDPASGLPLAWNPGRARGVGVFDMLATPAGLWVGSDTDRIGGWTKHPKIAFFPLAGGYDVPSTATQSLPGTVALAGNADGVPADGVATVAFDGAEVTGSGAAVNGGGISWSQSRGAVMIGDTLYTGWSDGNLYGRTFDGTTFGPATNVDGMDQLVRLTDFHNQVPSITAMFFDSGRLYYALAGDPALYYRGFTPSTKVVGAVAQKATNTSGITFGNVSAMLLSGGRLYVGDRTSGTLRAVSFSDGVVTGSPVTVSGPGVDGQVWKGRSIFIAPTVPNVAPVASFSAHCDVLTCTFDSAGSHDADGSIAAYSWSFGDGQSSTAADPVHTFANGGQYTVTLTVKDDRGATTSTGQAITVNDGTAAQVGFVGAASANANARSVSVSVPSGTAAGDTLLLVASSASDTVTLTAPAGWTAVSSLDDGGLQTAVWQRTATATDSGAELAVSSSSRAKTNVTLAVYSGVTADSPALVTATAESVKRASHTTPTADSTVAGSWVVSYWADDTGATTSWTAPSGQIVRGTEAGTGGGHISSLLTDGQGASPLGTVGGLVATADSSNVKAHMLTILLVPAS
ncbi:MAG TPA: PKD domain-containing protein [Actinomycetales bacterium]|nr:PKD domain-containing protein [Actinomycetales bacterium]